MPIEKAPQPQVPFDPEQAPFRFAPDAVSDAFALNVCQQTFNYLEQWRQQNQDERWSANEQLYYGKVKPRNWEGTNIRRSSVSVQKAAQIVDSAYSRISQEVIDAPDVLQVTPEAGASGHDALLVQARLRHLFDRNVDDYGWTMRMELGHALKDKLIYGNCFGLVEYDYQRRQGTFLRLDPRDVYVDPATPSPYIEAARAVCVRRVVTIDEITRWRGAPGFKIPPDEILYYFAKNRRVLLKDGAYASGTRGEAYNVLHDVYVTDPALQNVNLFIYFSHGREIWTLDNLVVIFNQSYPYGCTRIVSAPCITVPNRFYAESLVDRTETSQVVSTTLLNWHVDEVALAMNPPRSERAGVVNTPAQSSWRPNAKFQLPNPKDDMQVHMPPGMTQNIWQTLAYLDQDTLRSAGLSSMTINGTPMPSNANRTSSGIGQQIAGSDGRLEPIARNFEDYLVIPMYHKILKIEALHEKLRQGGGRGY